MTQGKPTYSALQAENARLREALKEAESVLTLTEHTPPRDPQYHGIVDAIGAAIGYGALMATAERAWHDKLNSTNMPPGGEYVAGPCRSTVNSCLANLRAALQPEPK